MDQIILDHHLTSLEEKNSMKWSKSGTTDIMDAPECYNISSSGKEVLKAITHGNQLTRSLLQTY